MSQLLRYIFPRRKLARPLRKITADYDRTHINLEEKLILMARMARDPMDARRIYTQLKNEHGNNVFKQIYLQIRRSRIKTARERLMMVLRQALGENEPRRFERRHKQEAIVKVHFSSDKGE